MAGAEVTIFWPINARCKKAAISLAERRKTVINFSNFLKYFKLFLKSNIFPSIDIGLVIDLFDWNWASWLKFCQQWNAVLFFEWMQEGATSLEAHLYNEVSALHFLVMHVVVVMVLYYKRYSHSSLHSKAPYFKPAFSCALYNNFLW